MNPTAVTFNNKLTSQKLSSRQIMLHCNKHVFEAQNTDTGNQGNTINISTVFDPKQYLFSLYNIPHSRRNIASLFIFQGNLFN